MAPQARVSHEGGGLWLVFQLSSEGGVAGLCFQVRVCLRASSNAGFPVKGVGIIASSPDLKK